MRYNRMRDIGLTEEQIKNNLLFATDKVGETMKASLDAKQAKDWFGAAPPDLTRDRALARRRRARAAAPTTCTPTCAPSTATTAKADRLEQPGLPQRRHAACAVGTAGRAPAGVREEERARPRRSRSSAAGKSAKPGTLTRATYDAAVADLVAFLQWMGEPAQKPRVQLGVWVLLFLVVFTVIAWRLNAAYWKDVK